MGDSDKNAIDSAGLSAIVPIRVLHLQEALLHTSLDMMRHAGHHGQALCCSAASNRCDVTKLSEIDLQCGAMRVMKIALIAAAYLAVQGMARQVKPNALAPILGAAALSPVGANAAERLLHVEKGLAPLPSRHGQALQQGVNQTHARDLEVLGRDAIVLDFESLQCSYPASSLAAPGRSLEWSCCYGGTANVLPCGSPTRSPTTSINLSAAAWCRTCGRENALIKVHTRKYIPKTTCAHDRAHTNAHIYTKRNAHVDVHACYPPSHTYISMLHAHSRSLAQLGQ